METSLAENLEKKRVGLSLAYEAVMTDDAARMLAYGRNKNRRHEGRIALLQGLEIKDQQIEDEDDVIHVGDIITNQIMPGASSASATAESKSPSSAPAATSPVPSPLASAVAPAIGRAIPLAEAAATGMTTVGKIAAAVSLAGGLLGLGATGSSLISGAASDLTNAVSVQVQGQDVPPGQSTTITTPPGP